MNVHIAKASQQVMVLELEPTCLSLITLLRSKSVSQDDLIVIFKTLIQAATIESKIDREKTALEALNSRLISSRYLVELKTAQEQFVLNEALIAAAYSLHYKFQILGINLLTDPSTNNCSLELGALYPNRIVLFVLPNTRVSI